MEVRVLSWAQQQIRRSVGSKIEFFGAGSSNGCSRPSPLQGLAAEPNEATLLFMTRLQIRTGSFFVIACCASLVVSNEATACDCSVLSAEGEFQTSELVFEGLVTRGNEGPKTNAEFEVLKVWKGHAPRRITVPMTLGDCAVVVRTGERRLIFVNQVEDQSRIHFCARHPLVGSKHYREAIAWFSKNAAAPDGGTAGRR